MSKQQNPYKGFYNWWNNDQFSHKYACWANNHRGWAKMKKFNKRIAKRRLKQHTQKDIKEELQE